MQETAAEGKRGDGCGDSWGRERDCDVIGEQEQAEEGKEGG